MPANPKYYLRIQDAAEFLSVSSKTLRRWEASGKLVPIRTKGNQRKYTRQQLENMLVSKSGLTRTVLVKDSPIQSSIPVVEPPKAELPEWIKTKPESDLFSRGGLAGKRSARPPLSSDQVPEFGYLRKTVTTVMLASLAAALLLLGGSSLARRGLARLSPPQGVSENPKVLAAATSDLSKDQILEIAIPTTFKQNITAPNIIYSLVAGQGIAISTGQKPTITNTQPGWSSIIVTGGSTLTPATSSASLTFTGGTGISLTTSGDAITVNGVPSALNVSGWTDGGTSVYLQTITDLVGIGTSSPTHNLDVTGTFGVTGASYLSTLNLSTMTAGSIPFFGAAGLLSQDNANLYWDATNARLGIGTSAPQAGLHVGTGGTPTHVGDNDVYIQNDLEVGGTIYGGLTGTFNPGFTLGSVVFQGASGLAQNNANFFWDNPDARLGLGTTTPAYPLDVVGTVQITGSGFTGLKLPTGAALNYVLTTDGAGQASWTNPNGAGSFGSWTLTGTTVYPNLTTYNVVLGSNNVLDSVAKFVNTGSTLYKPLAVADLPTGGDIGTAATTVDIYTGFNLTQTTAGQTITLPTPTSNTYAGRLIYLSNTGSVPFTFLSSSVLTGTTTQAMWNGTAWTLAGSNSGLPIGTANNDTMRWNSATSTWQENTGVIITSAGLLGIGNTAPTAKLDIGDSTLNTTNLANLSSTSTALTTGSLMALDWSPTGSTTIYATGDLFSINAGQYASVGNLLNLKDNGSSVFSVSQTQVTSSIPAAFNAAGDVGIAYDLVLTNQTASNIKSLGPLTIESGENFESNDLTLRSFNTGNVVIDAQSLVTNYSATVSSQLVVGTSTPTAASFGNFYLTNSATFGKALAILNQTEAQPILVASASGVNKFYIDSTGNVGIGTTAVPAYKLDIATSTASDRGVNIANTATAGTNYGLYSSVTGAATTNYGGYFISTGATTDYGLSVAPMTGATSTALDIGALTGSATNTAINIGGISGAGANYGINIGTITGGTTNYAIYSAGGTNYFAGNIGIGITAPTANLHVVGTQPASVGTTPGTVATGFEILTGGTGGNTSIATTGIGGIGAAWAVTGGIGGTADSAVTADTGGKGGGFTLTTGTGGAANASAGIKIGGAGGAFNILGGAGGATTGAGTSNTGGAGGNIYLAGGVGGTASGASANTAGAAGNVLLAINSAGTAIGLVGIGTTAPISELQVRTNTTTLTGKATAIFDQYEAQDLLTASASGTTKAAITSTGSLLLGSIPLEAGTASNAVCFEAVSDNGSSNLMQLVDCKNAPADLAEMYPASPEATQDASLIPQAGEVVTIGPNLGTYTTSDGTTHQAFSVVKANTEYDQKMIGVVSTEAWQVMGKDVLEWADNAVAVALNGRVPVKIASSSAEIKAGDMLTSSTVPGEAMKATGDGYTLGKALEDWSCPPSAQSLVPSACKSTILVFLNNSVDINNTLASASSSADLSTRVAILEGDVALLKNQVTLNRTDSVSQMTGSVLSQFSVDSLTVTDQANLPDTLVTGDLSATGNLASLKGNLVLTAGKIMGNSSFRDTAVIPAGADHVVIQKSWDTAPVSVTVTAGYDTGVWVENVTKTGFTIKVKNIPTVNSNVYWVAIW